MKRIALIALVPALLLSACASSTSVKHYTVVPQTQVTVREKKEPQHKKYSVHPEEEYVSGSGSR